MELVRQLVARAWSAHTAVPGFNIPYLPMMEPVVRALRDTRSLGLIMVARLEWEKFQSGSPERIAEEYRRVGDPAFTRLHLDHVPVIDEDQRTVDYMPLFERALAAGFDSVMVDGSRLDFAGNVEATRRVVDRVKSRGIPVEGELGAVMGHESGPLPPYDEIFRTRSGFTAPDEAARFVAETGVSWLSVAIGNIHGAISDATRGQTKLEARLDLEHLSRIRDATGIPLVLHGGTGIRRDMLQQSIGCGIAKINVATAIRQPYERVLREGGPEAAAVQAVYQATVEILRNELAVAGNADVLLAN